MELIVTHRKAAADYLEYRRAVEAIAAEFAARRATDDDRALLGEIMARMQAAHESGDFQEEAAIDVEFHNAIGECAHNIVLLHTLRSCYRLLSNEVFHNRLMLFALPGAREELLAQHRAIHDAVASGDAAGARAASVRHIDFIERAMAEADAPTTGGGYRGCRLSQRSEGGAATGSAKGR